MAYTTTTTDAKRATLARLAQQFTESPYGWANFLVSLHSTDRALLDAAGGETALREYYASLQALTT